jgi:cysteine-rich repeat protein
MAREISRRPEDYSGRSIAVGRAAERESSPRSNAECIPRDRLGGRMRFRRSLSLVLATISILAAAAAARAAGFADDFFDPVRDPFWSFNVAGIGPTAAESTLADPDGELLLTIPANSTGGFAGNVFAIYQSNCVLQGDFDVSVDYDLRITPTNPNRGWGVNIQMFSAVTGAPIIGIRRGNSGFGDIYISGANNAPVYVSTTDTSGRLRFKREGTTATSYYWDSNNLVWIQLAQWTFTSDPVTLAVLTLERNDIQPMEVLEVALDNFALTVPVDATFVCPYLYVCGNGTQDPNEACDDGNQNGADGCCDCTTNPPAAADVSGGWQLTLSCNDGFSQSVRPVAIAQTSGSSAATMTFGDCGTFTSETHTEPVTACVPAASDTAPVEICGNTFAYRTTAEESTFAGFPTSVGCQDLGQLLLNDPRYHGTVTADGSNRAVRIGGSYTISSARLYDEGQAQTCLDASGASIVCTFDMGRNVATPANPTVEPLPNLSIGFSGTFTEPVTVLVTPQDTPVATVPHGFLALGQYFEISSTGALPSGQIQVCIPYDPNVPLADQTIGHQDGAVFTVLPVTVVGNSVCATVDHFSQFALLVVSDCGNGTKEYAEECDDGNAVDDDCCDNTCHLRTGPCPDDGDLCTDDVCGSGVCTHVVPNLSCAQAASGKGSLALKRSEDGSKRSVNWKWTGEDPFDVADLGDPGSSTDLALCVYDANGLVLSARAPAGDTCGGKPCWSIDAVKGKLKYGDKDLTPDGVSKIQGKSGLEGKGKLAFQGKGTSLDILHMILPAPIHARLVRSGDDACWETTVSSSVGFQKNDETQLKAKSD